MRLFVTADGGDVAAAPEHTPAAYAAAAAAGADAIGICVRLAADGVPVVCRSATGAAGPVHAPSSLALAEVDPVVPRLVDVVSALAGSVDFELRLASPEPELIPAVVEALAAADPDRILVTSSYTAVLSRLADAAPELHRGLLLPGTGIAADVVAHEAISRARLTRADAVHLHPAQITAAVLADVDAASLSLHVTDADVPADVRRLAALGLARFATGQLTAVLALRDAK